MTARIRKLLKIAFVASVILLAPLSAGNNCLAASEAGKILNSFGRQSGLFVILGCGDKGAPKLATDLGANGNSLVHAVALDAKELADFNKTIADGDVKGCVSAEELSLSTLPYRDYMVNVMIIMDTAKTAESGLKIEEIRRCLAPYGRLVICSRGKIEKIEEIPLPPEMDIWTHRYHAADGIPLSNDKVFDLPVGFKWTAGLPMNFNNPKRAANRYSSTRAMVIDDGRCFTFSTGVYDNLGDGWRSAYGTDQYLTCRDAFNGRFLWRTKIGDTYYGGLYIENLAPLVSSGTSLYLAGANGKIQIISTRTGKTVSELPTTYIPGVIAVANGIVVAATWKDGKVMGSIKRYDRRRMDWEIAVGTIEAYSEESGKLLWKKELLGTSMLIAEGRVYIVSRSKKDELEKNHSKKGSELTRPPQKIVAMKLTDGEILWEAEDESFGFGKNRLSLDAAGHGAVVVADAGRRSVKLLSGETGKILEPGAIRKLKDKFFRFRNHICTPVLRVNDIVLANRGGTIIKSGKGTKYGGTRAACLTGSVPAYGSAFVAQNWCRCSPGQIQGLMAIAPIGKQLTPAEMETANEPTITGSYDQKRDSTPDSSWMTFRGNAGRSSASPCDIPKKISVVWSKKMTTTEVKDGTLKRDWTDYLNSRLTAAVISGDTAIVGDMDHNEIVAFSVKTGQITWRFMTGGRMDTSPTLYKGICLVGDRTGYVSALKIKDGTLIYRLRIAPEEKRMLSYGKVESVWPVIGGVMVSGDKAYASAGRTQGSDGGLVVRAFSPDTGKQLWAKAIPQSGNGVQTEKPKQNDALIESGEFLTLMEHRIMLNNGQLVASAAQELRNSAMKDAKEKLKRRLNWSELTALRKKLAPKIAELVKSEKGISLGCEGLYSWNWTRLGHRKFIDIGYCGVRGDTLSFKGAHTAACNKSNVVSLTGVKKNVKIPVNRQVTSLILCNNALVLGGAILDTKAEKGFIQALSVSDLTPVWEKTFTAKLSFNGLAVDKGTILGTFNDGSVVCLE